MDHRMRETERQIELVALGLGTITDADEGELALETLRNTGHHVIDQRAIGARQGVCIGNAFDSTAHHCAIFELDLDRRNSLCIRVPSGPLIEITPASFLNSTPAGKATGFFATRDIVQPPHATMQSTSPPTLLARAARSVITPFGWTRSPHRGRS